MPPNETEFTANSITIGSFAFSLRLRFVTVSVTVEPAGMTAPLEPVTAFCVVAVILSPTLLVFVQTVAVGVSESVVPASIVPTAPPLFEAPVLAGCVTVLPLAVLVGPRGVSRVGVVVRGLGHIGARGVSRVGVDGRVVRGVVRAGADVAGGFAGTSFSCGCAVLSRPASARSRPNADVSRLSALVVSCFELSVLQAPSATTAPSASGAIKRPVYFAIDPPLCVRVRP